MHAETRTPQLGLTQAFVKLLYLTNERESYTRVYSAAIDNYNGHQRVVDPLQLAPGDTDVVVRSHFQKTGAPAVEVNYSMWKSPQGWKVYDINVENVSLVITYRTQFSEEVARSGIEGLIAKLAEKNRNAAP